MPTFWRDGRRWWNGWWWWSLYGRMDWITEDHILIRLPLAVRKMLLPFTYLNRTRYLVIKESMQPSAAAINANDMTWTDFANLWPNFQPKMKILAGQLAKQSPKSTIFRSRMRRRGEVEMLEWITNKVRISLSRLVRFYIFFLCPLTMPLISIESKC